ncbi:hypothetical protein NA56DRAFT_750676 [Hyaloscypha hepaticicola]|uniref:Uncharacterized protein n=1 Tax=Hyaloscypha hepaticicola TaxID=2082293 RepID=A0A2J6PZ14_9HELO|nr:hypothetical protein NA56DRAFT_750676 [Hyaloscypha hepaticicola]
MFHHKASGPPLEKPEKEVLAEPGNEAEPLLPAYSASQTTFASITLHKSDSLHIFQLPQKEIDGLRKIIEQCSEKGIQKERVLQSSCHEFKLRGNPWNTSSLTGMESISSRILIREMLAYLFSVGWMLHARSNDFFIFRHQAAAPPDTECIALFRDDLRAQGVLQDEYWKEEENNAWEFKIKGRPWSGWGEEMDMGIPLLLRIVELLDMHGWRLYTNATLHVPVQSGVMLISNEIVLSWQRELLRYQMDHTSSHNIF